MTIRDAALLRRTRNDAEMMAKIQDLLNECEELDLASEQIVELQSKICNCFMACINIALESGQIQKDIDECED